MSRLFARNYILLICVLACAGAALSAISLSHFLEFKYNLKAASSFCNINESFNCDAVNRSEWATIFGIPVASYGLAFYLTILLIVGELRESRSRLQDIIFLLATGAATFSVYLFVISEFLIGTLCLMCLGTYFVNFAFLLLSWWGTDRERSLVERWTGALNGSLDFVRALTGRGAGGISPATARKTLLMFGGIISAALLLPESLMYLRAGQSPRAGASADMREQLRRWKEQSPISLEVAAERGAFSDYTKGPADAPIQLVEFSDLQCPACRKFHLMLAEVLHRYPDKIRVVFKNYPLDNACNPGITARMHENACLAANLARCAGEQDKFWETVDYLFSLDEGKKSPGEVREDMLRSSTVLGMDADAIMECIESGRQGMKIRADIELGDRHKIEGTPTVWINGRLVRPLSVDMLTAILESIL